MAESTLHRLLAFDRQVRRDQTQSPVFLHRRDRRFALDCDAADVTPTADRWLRHLGRVGRLAWDDTSQPTTHGDSPSIDLNRWRHLALAFAAAGTIMGVITMAGLLYYEGGQRINLTLLLAFAALQCLLAVVTTGQSLVSWQPWKPLLQRLSLTGRNATMRPLYPVLMARVAHTGGACFGIAGVLTLLVLVVIQDLAFGWSTTLSAGAESYHRLLTTLAWPWQHLWPAAAPDLTLVEATRFYRTGTDNTDSGPALWGQWWPFVTMVWMTYVVLPRLIGLALASVQLRRRAERALRNHPGMVALEYRMETPTVDTGNQHNDASDLPDEHTSVQCQPLPESQLLIIWAGGTVATLPDSLTAGHLLTLTAGGQHSLADDQTTLEQGGELLTKQTRPAVTVITRAWEPPTGELADFIEQARQSFPEATQIALLPVASDATQPTSRHQLGQWLRFSERLSDEYLCVSQPDIRSPETRTYQVTHHNEDRK